MLFNLNLTNQNRVSDSGNICLFDWIIIYNIVIKLIQIILILKWKSTVLTKFVTILFLRCSG